MTTIIEKFENIGNTINLLYEFVINNDYFKDDLDEYIKTVGITIPRESMHFQSAILPYIFERKIENKSVFEIYLKKNDNIPEDIKEILLALKNSVYGIFEISKILKNGFELYNLLNEKKYTVISLVKMTNYRGIFQGQFASCRIFEFENEYYLLEIADTYGQTAKENILRYLVATIIQSPEKAYIDNKDKENKIYEHAKNSYTAFMEIFNTDEFITTNKKSDDILFILNDYLEKKLSLSDIDKTDLIVKPERYEYFKVSDFDNDYNNFLEKSLDGFSNQSSEYDVGFLVDKEFGLYILPFWGTLNEIFKQNSLENINGSVECIKEYLENDKLPLFVFDILNKRYDNFMEIVNNALDTNYTYNELIKEYKEVYIDNKIYSPTSVLFNSKVFTDITKFLYKDNNNTQEIDYSNVGRNDLCPCGSGKKYKNCCLKKNEELQYV